MQRVVRERGQQVNDFYDLTPFFLAILDIMRLLAEIVLIVPLRP